MRIENDPPHLVHIDSHTLRCAHISSFTVIATRDGRRDVCIRMLDGTNLVVRARDAEMLDRVVGTLELVMRRDI